MAHVDDFLVIGPSDRIKILRGELEKEFESNPIFWGLVMVK